MAELSRRQFQIQYIVVVFYAEKKKDNSGEEERKTASCG